MKTDLRSIVRQVRRTGDRFGSRSGVALVVTLILLAVITFMAIAFLVISHREQSSVVTATDQATAKNAADSAIEHALADLAIGMVTTTNAYGTPMVVSTNYQNSYGFFPGNSSPTNVSYDSLATGGTNFTAAQEEQNIANLLYNPRPPVYITNRALRTLDFRYYLDLNRNGRFEATGIIPEVGPTGITNPANLLQVQGDPQWVGVLQYPDRPHSPDNKFTSRFAYVVVPANDTLDINYIHNQATNLVGGQIGTSPLNYYRRNKGVGTWEINLGAFLCDLNTNLWGFYGYNPQNPLGWNLAGPGFSNALSILSYRYNGIAPQPARNVLPSPGYGNLGTDFIDTYGAGPVLTTAFGYRNFDPDANRLLSPWAG